MPDANIGRLWPVILVVVIHLQQSWPLFIVAADIAMAVWGVAVLSLAAARYRKTVQPR